ncbi:MAG: mechanosensitive ion channel [Chitinivibrionales bacterium]|nr:mechanosensitive ion channel [Chitinivibrionales bacterium]
MMEQVLLSFRVRKEPLIMEFAQALELVAEKIGEWGRQGVLLIPNIMVSLIVLVVAAIIAMVAARTSRRILGQFLKNISLVNFLGSVIRFCVLLAGVIIALNVLQLENAILSLLTGVGIVGIALGFAFQDMAANFISGIALVFRDDRPFKVGDIVETKEQIGIIKEIDLRATTMQTFDGRFVFIPNKQMFQDPVINFSFLGQRRVDIPVGISYGDDLPKVMKVAMDAVRDIPRERGSDSQTVELFFEEFGDSSINFQLRFWIPFTKQTDYLSARSDAVMRIKQAFDENDITIPFPIRTLDFGIKGGKTLRTMIGSGRKIEG